MLAGCMCVIAARAHIKACMCTHAIPLLHDHVEDFKRPTLLLFLSVIHVLKREPLQCELIYRCSVA